MSEKFNVNKYSTDVINHPRWHCRQHEKHPLNRWPSRENECDVGRIVKNNILISLGVIRNSYFILSLYIYACILY